MSWWEAALLGLIQGLTEFLPVSSSGHLVLGQYLLGVNEPSIIFEVFLHFGTVLSIVTVYRTRLVRISKDGLGALRRPGLLSSGLRPGSIEHTPPQPFSKEIDESGEPVPAAQPDSSIRLILFILFSMVPTGLVYLFFGGWLEGLFEYPRFACGMLLVTGTLLLLTRLRMHPDGVLSWGKALLIGLAQGAAMTPGISRSGATICTAIYLNVDRKEAADFSFLMSLPVIVGATLIKVLALFGADTDINWLLVIIGTLIAYASGIWAIRVVIAFVQRGSLIYFAVYCYIIGILGLIVI